MTPSVVIKSRGTFDFEVRDAEGVTKSRSIVPSKKTLLDGFFTNVATVAQPINTAVIRCGTGSAPRTTNMTALTAQMTLLSGTWPLASVTHGTMTFDSATNSYIAVSTYVSTFAIGQLSGNISEWGVEFNNVQTANRTTIHASALATDVQGNPTTVQIQATEQLIVTYRLETRIPATDFISTTAVIINGVTQSTTITGRWGVMTTADKYYGNSSHQLTCKAGPLGAVATALSGATLGTKSATFVSESGIKKIRASLLVSEWNFGSGIQFVSLNSDLIKYEFSPGIPKIAGQTCTIDIQIVHGRL